MMEIYVSPKMFAELPQYEKEFQRFGIFTDWELELGEIRIITDDDDIIINIEEEL